ncbi:hypothetical protein CDD81_778 [Ophiocordyceps australis]|uniref:Mitochondrial import inner membrane translocase subunit n=1 Tax=Ophiocordyceps australis TaxID=1399860 RepID=A0A2C5Y0B8_9HYPO|nr:hypothetical protein CDD81_778 [Ophiocordyceps australis]
MSESASELAKVFIMQQARLETNHQTLKLLGELVNKNCYAKCVPKPGSSLSSSEQSCTNMCVAKYIKTWDHIQATMIAKVAPQPSGSPESEFVKD